MKLLYIPTRYEGDIKLPKKLIDKLPSKIMLATTVQFKNQINHMKKQLEEAKKKVVLFKSVHGAEEGQILGCDIFEIKLDIEALLYIGDGMFHPTALLYNNLKSVLYYNPFNEELKELSQKDLKQVVNRKRASMARFYSADKIGVLVTTKPGQCNMKAALELKKRLEDKGKECYVFVEETLNISQLENFNFIDCWVNTACPRIVEDSDFAMINIWDLRDDIMKGFGINVV